MHSLRHGFTAYFVLSPENGSFASVAGSPGLTPAPRRQDHTTSPYAISVFVQHAYARLTLPRPPHPNPRS